MSREDMQSDEIEEIMKEMLNDDEYADEGFEDIDREDNRHESKKAMKKERKAILTQKLFQFHFKWAKWFYRKIRDRERNSNKRR